MKQFKQIFSFLFILVFAFSLVACGNNGNNENEQVNEETTQQQTETEQATGEDLFPLTLNDALDNSVTFEKAPEKIVSLIPSNTEILFALGLGHQVVGVSDFDDYPAEVESKEKIGGMEFNVEKIISLQPDLVLAHESGVYSGEEGLQQLRDAGITVFIVKNANTFSDVFTTIETIAQINNKVEQGQALLDDMQARVNSIKEKANEISEEDRVTVWAEISPAPDLYTTGQGTFMHEMLETIGANNAAGDQQGWPQYTEEDAVLLNPDVIVITYDYIENPVEQVLSREAWHEVTAIKDERVHLVNSNLVSRPGPRVIEGVEELAKTIYPDVFK